MAGEQDFEKGFEALDALHEVAVSPSSGGLTVAEESTFVEVVAQSASAEVFGECDTDAGHCQFYGPDVKYCDRSCTKSVWDQA